MESTNNQSIADHSETRRRAWQSLVLEIKTHLATKGNLVQITTYTRSVIYDHRHVESFKIDAEGSPRVRRGKNWDHFGYCSIRLGRIEKVCP